MRRIPPSPQLPPRTHSLSSTEIRHENPVRVAVTGAAGQIGYALLFRIAAGEMLGRDQPVMLQLLELPIDKAQAALKGVMMELEDCAFPLLAGMTGTGDPNVAFKDADYALLVGAQAARSGHGTQGPAAREREDLHRAGQGAGQRSHPATSGCWSSAIPPTPTPTSPCRSAPSLPKKNFTAMMRLDHNRALSQLALKTGKPVDGIEKLCVWGNHSPTMYADYRFATVGGQSVKAMIDDEDWNRNVFLPTVGKRGAAIIEARGLSSAASAANAAIGHVRDWTQGTNGKWVTMGVASDGSYGIPQDVMYGVPVTTAGGEYTRVTGLADRRLLPPEDGCDAQGARGRAGRRRRAAGRLDGRSDPVADELRTDRHGSLPEKRR